MKRTTILALVYAIVVTMVVVTFSLYRSTLNVQDSVIGTKIFDISQTTTVQDSKYLENTPSWLFMAFNTSAISGSNYDMNVQVSLNTSSTSGLQLGLYDQSNNQLALVSFSGSTASMSLIQFFPQGSVSEKMLTLKYIYNGLPISPSNIPFAANTVTASVTVWGTKSVVPDQDIINAVLANRWCTTYLVPTSPSRTQVRTYLKVPVPGITSAVRSYNNSRTGSISIVFDKTAGTLTVYRGTNVANQFTAIDTSTYVNPDTIVIRNTNSSSTRRVVISNLNLNGTVNAGPYLEYSTPQVVLFKNFVTNADGSFTISFDYSTTGNNAEFSINVGYAP
jgi:hypothetical protein